MANANDFVIEQRPTGEILMHKTEPVWIVGYEAIDGVRAPFWQGYRAVAHIPKGRKPWTVDNRRITSERGFPTIEAAIAAA